MRDGGEWGRAGRVSWCLGQAPEAPDIQDMLNSGRKFPQNREGEGDCLADKASLAKRGGDYFPAFLDAVSMLE